VALEQLSERVVALVHSLLQVFDPAAEIADLGRKRLRHTFRRRRLQLHADRREDAEERGPTRIVTLDLPAADITAIGTNGLRKGFLRETCIQPQFPKPVAEPGFGLSARLPH
jgi:hypothetical protein